MVNSKFIAFLIVYLLTVGLMIFLSSRYSYWFIAITMIISVVLVGAYFIGKKISEKEEKKVNNDAKAKLTTNDAVKILKAKLLMEYKDRVGYIYKQYPSMIGEEGKETTPIYTIHLRSFWGEKDFYFLCNMNHKDKVGLIEVPNDIDEDKLETLISGIRNTISDNPQYENLSERQISYDAFGKQIVTEKKRLVKKEIREAIEKEKNDAEVNGI